MIVVPFTNLQAATATALNGVAWQGCYVGGSDQAYYRLLARLWRDGDTFTVVEHDIIPTREALDSLHDCPADWCACPYPYVWGGLFAGLGCTRFDAELIARHLDLMAAVADMSDDTHPPMHWCRLDAWITNTLTGRGERRCEAHPQVGHAMTDETASAHGCYCASR